MCGRFAQPNLFDMNKYRCVKKIGALDPRFNIAPTSLVPVIRVPQGETDAVMETLKWGFVTTWAQTPNKEGLLANARGETVAEKRSFKDSFQKRRCLVPVSGFYEWQQNTLPKQPHYFFMKNKEPFLLAGLWEKGKAKEGQGEAVDTFTLITTEANTIMKPVHDRMPVILDEKDFDVWLDPKNQDIQKLKELLKPYDPQKMDCYPVSTYVSNARNEGPDCVKPLSK